jgi:Holliday junction DNA helicase RuvB
MDEERLASGDVVGAEEELDRSLRPRRLDDFIGQEGVKQQLSIFLEAARQRGEALDHVLLAGPPGLGKTSLAGIVAGELGVGFHVTSGPVLERKGDLAAVLTALEPHDVLFIDEIHRLNRAIEEVLYPAMEDFQLDVVLGQGPSARTLRLDLPRFTLIGATTRTGLLTTPLRARFGVHHRLNYYDAGELAAIVRRSARLLEVEIDGDGAATLAQRSRGTPRIANRLLRRVRDVAQVRGAPGVDRGVAEEALDLLEVDALGLEELDRQILRRLAETFEGRPVGLGTLADSVGEAADTIEDVYEPYLLQEGLLKRTPRGRVATARAYRHLGLRPPAEVGQPGLF